MQGNEAGCAFAAEAREFSSCMTLGDGTGAWVLRGIRTAYTSHGESLGSFGGGGAGLGGGVCGLHSSQGDSGNFANVPT